MGKKNSNKGKKNKQKVHSSVVRAEKLRYDDGSDEYDALTLIRTIPDDEDEKNKNNNNNSETQTKNNKNKSSGFIEQKSDLDENTEFSVDDEDSNEFAENSMDQEFIFDSESRPSSSWDFTKTKNISETSNSHGKTSVDEKIDAQLAKRKARILEQQQQQQQEQQQDNENDDNDDEITNDDKKSKNSDKDNGAFENAIDTSKILDESHDTVRQIKSNVKTKPPSKFFAEAPDVDEAVEFESMRLCRQLLKAVSDLNWGHPTPIQARMVPIALLGRDCCANAVTGSGKTAAFSLPALERLAHRSQSARAATRVLILLPTRELAAQCHAVMVQLSKYLDVSIVVLAGGTSLAASEAALRNVPDVVVATPGRLIDHLRNTPGFDLDDLEILVLDEADRLLELGFEDELAEIVKMCPRQRQTLLLSATMTDSVERLTKLSLHHPVRVRIDHSLGVADTLTQEFVRVRNVHKKQRAAMLLALCTRAMKSNTIVFCARKKEAHRLKVIFGLLGLRAAELHGDMKQRERLESLEKFRDNHVDFLIATDVAARGLDIVGVRSVINYTMPPNHKSYVHRVGRTARAQARGRAVSLIGENDRKLLKEITKVAKGKVLARSMPPEVIIQWSDKIDAIQDDIAEILAAEKAEKELASATMELAKAKNLVRHSGDIHARPARTWFQSSDDKKKASKLGAMDTGDDTIDVAQLKANLEAAKANALKLGVSLPKRERKLSRKKRRARENAAKAKSDPMAGTAGQKAIKRKFNSGTLAIGDDSKKKRKTGEKLSKKAQIEARINKGANSFADEIADVSTSAWSQHKNRKIGGVRGRTSFKSKQRYKRR